MGGLRKKLFLFFFVYFLLFCSLILAVINMDRDRISQNSDVNEFSNVFKVENEVYEKRIEGQKRDQEKSNGWKPSKQFVMTAVILASILDIIIILLWARYENKKRNRVGTFVKKPKLTDKVWFWNVMAMGFVQPRNGRIKINWRNLIIFILTMYVIKKWFFTYVWKEDLSFLY